MTRAIVKRDCAFQRLGRIAAECAKFSRLAARYTSWSRALVRAAARGRRAPIRSARTQAARRARSAD